MTEKEIRKIRKEAELQRVIYGHLPFEILKAEMLRHTQESVGPSVVKTVVTPPPSETKWWRRFEKRKKY